LKSYEDEEDDFFVFLVFEESERNKKDFPEFLGKLKKNKQMTYM